MDFQFFKQKFHSLRLIKLPSVKKILITSFLLYLFINWLFFSSTRSSSQHHHRHRHTHPDHYHEYSSKDYRNDLPEKNKQLLESVMWLGSDSCLSAPEIGSPHLHLALRDRHDPSKVYHILNPIIRDWSILYSSLSHETFPFLHSTHIFQRQSLDDLIRFSSSGKELETMHRSQEIVDEPSFQACNHSELEYYSHTDIIHFSSSDVRSCLRWNAIVVEYEPLESKQHKSHQRITETFIDTYAHCLQLYHDFFTNSRDCEIPI